MRFARSSRESNTTALPSRSNKEASAAERFRMAPFGASEPNSATRPPSGSSGAASAEMMARSTQASSSPASRSPSVSPVTVMQSRSSSGFSSRRMAPMPPAAKKSSM